MPGSAAVGVRQTGDDTLVADGTFSGTESAPVQAGSTVLQSYGPNGLNAAENMQGVGPATNPYQEVNLFIGEMAQKLGCGPRAAWERIREIGRTTFEQSFS